MVHITWSTPPTWTVGQMVTSTQLNTLSQDLNETAPAKATASATFFAATGVNNIAERRPSSASLNTTQTTSTATTWVDLATVGAQIANITVGTAGLVLCTGGMFNTTANAECYIGYEISGASSVSPVTDRALRHTSATASAQLEGTWAFIAGFTPGNNTVTQRYYISSGTGSFFDRRLSVVPF